MCQKCGKLREYETAHFQIKLYKSLNIDFYIYFNFFSVEEQQDKISHLPLSSKSQTKKVLFAPENEGDLASWCKFWDLIPAKVSGIFQIKNDIKTIRSSNQLFLITFTLKAKNWQFSAKVAHRETTVSFPIVITVSLVFLETKSKTYPIIFIRFSILIRAL